MSTDSPPVSALWKWKIMSGLVSDQLHNHHRPDCTVCSLCRPSLKYPRIIPDPKPLKLCIMTVQAFVYIYSICWLSALHQIILCWWSESSLRYRCVCVLNIRADSLPAVHWCSLAVIFSSGQWLTFTAGRGLTHVHPYSYVRLSSFYTCSDLLVLFTLKKERCRPFDA